MSMHLTYISLLSIIFIAAADAAANRCYNKSEDFYPFMSTRTPYKYVNEGNVIKKAKPSK